MALYNLVCAVTSTLGTGSVVTGAAVAGYNNWSGVPNGAVVSYGIREKNAVGVLTQSEAGLGTWNAGTSTLSRDTVRSSTSGGAKINLTTGIAEVYITAHAEDFDHALLLNIGVNTHVQIDAHIANTSNPHSTTAAQVGASPLGHSHSESDPIFSASVAAGIDAGDISSWDSKQAGDATLTSIAALGTAADRMIYTAGVDTWAESTLTAFARTMLDDANAAAVLTTIGAQAALGFTPVDSASASWIDLTDGGGTTLHTHAYEPIDATIVRTGQANWIDLTDGGATTLHTHTGFGDISGTGIVGQVAEFVTNTKTIQAAKLIGPAANILTITNAAVSTLALNITSAKTLTLTAADNYTLTIPATGTVALLATANVFTTQQMVDGTSDQIQLRVQAHSSQTASLQTWETSAGTVVARFLSDGSLVIVPPVAANVTSANISANTNSSGSTVGIDVTVSSTAAFNSGDLNLFGIRPLIATSSGRAPFNAISQTNQFSVGSAGISNAIGNNVYISSSAGTISNFYGIRLGSYASVATNVVQGTITNAYGIYINPLSGATTINAAIYTNAGQVSVLGDMTKASAAGATWAGIEFRAATGTITGSTNITNATGFNYFSIAQPTLSAASALTVTSSATLYIANSPLGGGAGPATITNAYSIWIDAGLSRFDGNGTYIFELPADATGNATAATGRIPVKIGGATKYLRYFDD